MILDAEFHNFVQGDLSISEYCRCLKGMADAFGDLGEVVLDRSLMLIMLCSLNGHFSHMAALLKQQCPFLTFIDVRNDLQLEEIELASKPGSSATAIVAYTASAGCAPSARPSVLSPVCLPMLSNTVAKNNNYRKNNSKQGGSNQQQGGSKQQHCFFATPTATNSWLRSLQLYGAPRVSGPGWLGPRPGMPPQAPLAQ
jgi:hypothetical protein